MGVKMSLRAASGLYGCAPDDRLRDEATHAFFATMDRVVSLAMTILQRNGVRPFENRICFREHSPLR